MTRDTRGAIELRDGRVRLSDLALTVPARLVVGALPSASGRDRFDVGGDVSVSTADFVWPPPGARGEATLRWDGARLALPDGGAAAALGSVTLRATATGDRIAGPVTNVGGDVALAGSVEAAADGVVRGSVLATPRDGADPRLAQLLGRGRHAGGGRRAHRLHGQVAMSARRKGRSARGAPADRARRREAGSGRSGVAGPAGSRRRGGRVAAIDALRGIAILAMIAYHFAFDLRFFGLTRSDFEGDPFWLTARAAIVTSFLLLVGVSLLLAYEAGVPGARFNRRVALIAACALAVTIGSYLVFPQRFIYFGILHCIAVSSLLARPLAARPRLALALGVAAIVAGLSLSHPFFDGRATSWLGFNTVKPPTEDFVPLFPWLGVVLVGIGLGAGSPGATSHRSRQSDAPRRRCAGSVGTVSRCTWSTSRCCWARCGSRLGGSATAVTLIGFRPLGAAPTTAERGTLRPLRRPRWFRRPRSGGTRGAIEVESAGSLTKSVVRREDAGG